MYLGMIVYRILNAQHDAQGFIDTGSSIQPPKTTRLDSVIRIVIDSALGYTLVSLTLFFSQVARSNAIYITSGAVSFIWLTIHQRDVNTRGFEGDPDRRNRIQSY